MNPKTIRLINSFAWGTLVAVLGFWVFRDWQAWVIILAGVTAFHLGEYVGRHEK